MAHDWNKRNVLRCACGWATTWGEYRASYQKRQLFCGGTLAWITEFVEAFPRSTTARERMTRIDCLLHQYHWGLAPPEPSEGPGGPSRPAAVNLIEGSTRSIMALLDALGELAPPDDPVRRQARADFHANRRANRAKFRERAAKPG